VFKTSGNWGYLIKRTSSWQGVKNTSNYSQLSAAVLLQRLTELRQHLLVYLLWILDQNISDILKG